MARAYLDHASTTPLRPAALAAMTDVLTRAGLGELGDPSRSHHEGLAARHELENARSRIAAALGARPREVVLCSGASEAIATASYGALARAVREGVEPCSVLTAVEHAAVRMAAARGRTTVVGVDGHGRVDPAAIADAIEPGTAIVHLQWANHEVGTIQPIAEVAAVCRERGVLLHVDAAQAVGHVPVDFGQSGIDLLSVSAHKFGGPTGAGALLVRRGLRLDPMILGGDQERARRAGLESLAAASGFAAALDEATHDMAAEADRSRRLLDRVRAWAATDADVTELGDPDHHVPHLLCLAIGGIEPQPILIGLDRAGVAVHSGNSCSSEALEPSPVLAAMGVDAHRSLRVSVGWSTTDDDIDRLLGALPTVLDGLRGLDGRR